MAITTATVCLDLDAAVLKGLRLLHSADPDSEDQLRQLWKQCVYEKYGTDRTPVSVLHKINIPSGLKRESVQEPDDPVIETKKPKLGSSSPLFYKSAPASPSSNVASSYIPDDLEAKNSSSDNDSDSDTPLEILSGDGVCMKCKKSSFNNDNKIIECVDCHKHYHQQCHFPPITDMDLNDPRCVWYCSACEQSITITTFNDRNKSLGSSSTSSSKTISSSSSIKNSSSPAKSSRSYGSSLSSHRSGGSGTNHANSSSSSSSKGSPKPSSHDKKPSQSSHLMKKRPLKKPDKKKSSK